jgi:hypothetical protein
MVQEDLIQTCKMTQAPKLLNMLFHHQPQNYCLQNKKNINSECLQYSRLMNKHLI